MCFQSIFLESRLVRFVKEMKAKLKQFSVLSQMCANLTLLNLLDIYEIQQRSPLVIIKITTGTDQIC